MSSEPKRFEASYCSDGLFEVRERGEPDRWIASDSPVEIVR